MKILIPTYEPTEKLIKLIDEIQKLTDIDIIVINDGSSEKCKEIFETIKNRSIKLLEHETNKGKGQAIKTGIQYLIESGETEGCVTVDSDGQHAVRDVLKVIQELRSSKKDLILGVRNFKEKNVPFRSKFGNKISKVLFKAMTGEKISDTQTGLRGYSSRIFEWLLNIEGNRYEYEFNMLLSLKESKINYKTIEIETVYEENNKGSHFRIIRDSILIYKPVFKFIMSSIASTLIDYGLLLFLQYTTKNLLVSVVVSRLTSSIFNFICNKNYVFERKDSKRVLETAVKYYALVVTIMLLNYLILNGLYNLLHINLVISKIITEAILYPLSFIVQRRRVFTKS